MVVIVSSPQDIHGRAVAREVAHLGGRFKFLDTAIFPVASHVSVSAASGISVSGRFAFPDGDTITTNEISGVWWRRPQPFGISADLVHPKVKSFVRGEAHQALVGMLASTVAKVINPFAASRHAALKLVQLQAAEVLGFSIPKTIVTNDPNEAIDFYNSSNCDCVYKLFSGTDFGFYETRRLGPEDLSDIQRLSTCPLIIQEHVKGDFDVRATVVGKEVFAASLHYKEGNHPIDSRLSGGPVRRHELPETICEQLIGVTRRLGLEYAAIDLRYSQEQGYVFFEMNPEGQYLWTEIDADLPISNSIARHLLR